MHWNNTFLIRSVTCIVLMLLHFMGFAQQPVGSDRLLRQGWYGGLGVTGAFDRFQLSAEHTTDQYAEEKSERTFSVLGSAFIGYGHTLGRRLFIGAEAGTSLPKRTGVIIRQGVVFTGGRYTDHLSVQDLVTGDLLLGYRLIDRTLCYMRGGATWARIHLDQDVTPSVPDSAFSEDAYRIGGRIGIGLHYHLTDRLGVGVDHVITLYQAYTPLWEKFNLQFDQRVTSGYFALSASLQIGS